MGVESSKIGIKNNISNELDSSVSDYLSLLKPRVMSLAVFTSVCGLLLAPGDLHPFLWDVSGLHPDF